MFWRRQREERDGKVDDVLLGPVRIHLVGGELIDMENSSATFVSKAYQQAMMFGTAFEIHDPRDGKVLYVNPDAIVWCEDLLREGLVADERLVEERG